MVIAIHIAMTILCFIETILVIILYAYPQNLEGFQMDIRGLFSNLVFKCYPSEISSDLYYSADGHSLLSTTG